MDGNPPSQSDRSERVDLVRDRLTFISQALLVTTVIIAALEILESVFKPFFIAIALFLALRPGAQSLMRGGVPQILAYMTMLLGMVTFLLALGTIAAAEVTDLMTDETRVEEYENGFLQWADRANGWGISPVDATYAGATDHEHYCNGTYTEADRANVSYDGPVCSMQELFTSVGLDDTVSSLTNLLVTGIANSFSVMLTSFFFMIFIIFEANFLPRRVQAAFAGNSEGRFQRIMEKAQGSVNKYVIVKTGVSAGTAGFTAVILLIFGIDLWFVWTLLTFLLNFVPYIGSLFACIPPILLGIALYPDQAWISLLMTILLIVNQQIWGNYIENKWAGTALNLSPVVLLLVTAFSLWLWGVTGMILIVPFAVILKIVLENIDSTRSFAILISERAPDFRELWLEALEDGIVENHEFGKLQKLQQNLGISEDEMFRVAGRAAIQTAIQRGTITNTEREFIYRIADASGALGAEVRSVVDEGSLDEEELELLVLLADHVDMVYGEEFGGNFRRRTYRIGGLEQE